MLNADVYVLTLLDAANYIDYINTDGTPLSEAYSRWIPNDGYNTVPYCAYHDSTDKLWHHTTCQVDRQAIYEYPALGSNFYSRGKTCRRSQAKLKK